MSVSLFVGRVGVGEGWLVLGGGGMGVAGSLGSVCRLVSLLVGECCGGGGKEGVWCCVCVFVWV